MRRRNGFTLIEILIAFVILAISSSTLLGIYSTGLSNALQSELRAAAVAHAQSILARVGTEYPLTEGTLHGQSGQRFSWQITNRPVGTSAECSAHKNSCLFEVDVVVAWSEAGAERSLALRTMRLAHE